MTARRELYARVHAVEPKSRANGPGVRFVIWLQGCTLACPGCFNPGTHDAAGGQRRAVEGLLEELAATRGIDGLTLSGGEPLQQAEAAAALLAGARSLGLSTLMFSGYTKDEIERLAFGADVLARLDVLVDGRYEASARLGHGLRGSANQRVLLLSGRYGPAELEASPEAEIRISPTGEVVLTGVNPLKLKR